MTTTITFPFTESGDFKLCQAVADERKITILFEANHLLSFAAYSAPEGGSYHKTDVVIEWGPEDDRNSYTFRCDIVPSMAGNPSIITGHLKSTIAWCESLIERAPNMYASANGTGTAYVLAKGAREALQALQAMPQV